jgi:hypothetical protein
MIIIPLIGIKVIVKKWESKTYIFTMNTICILMTGRATTSAKYESKKQFQF